ncbi:DUF6968 family protein [Cryobacterium zongtaii]|uniref:DUF6968 family protein n=1 Tax=Cryobacterium zongtaii TaxID=1259217 RepID=UPI003C2C0B57
MTTILSRTLSSPRGDVHVFVDAPRAAATDSAEWSCTYRIHGLAEDVTGTAHGIDAVQSILLALTQIGDRLAGATGLTFLGGSDLGFPLTSWNDAESTLSFVVRHSIGAPSAPSPS